MNEVKKLLGLDDKNIKILSIEEEKIKDKKVKIVNAITTIKDLNYELVDLEKTTKMSSNQLNEFYYDSNNVAKQMGVTYNAISRIEEGKDTNLSTALLYIDRMNEIDSSLDFWTLFLNLRGKEAQCQTKGMADNIRYIIQRTLESGKYTKDEENVEIYGIRPGKQKDGTRKFEDALYCDECEHFKRKILNDEGYCKKLNRFFYKCDICAVKFGKP